jgi:hypothetical protein
MKVLIKTQRPVHRWILISAALLIYADGARAADYVGDPQMQARTLLTGTSAGRPNVDGDRITQQADGHRESRIGPQEQARQLILGTADLSRVTVPPVSATKRTAQSFVSNSVNVDPLESARRMILGLAG